MQMWKPEQFIRFSLSSEFETLLYLKINIIDLFSRFRGCKATNFIYLHKINLTSTMANSNFDILYFIVTGNKCNLINIHNEKQYEECILRNLNEFIGQTDLT